MTEPLTILYQDDYLVAVDKPSGIPVHRDEFMRRDAVVCVQILRDQLQCDLHPVHRLDGGTSGVLLFGYERSTLAAMMTQFMERQVQKTYHAITRGWMPSQIACDVALKKADRSFDAVTNFRSLKHLTMPWPNERFSESRYSFVEATPQTGRFHQIRRHANYLSYPLVGDTAHGDSEHNRLWRTHRNSWRLLLHASRIEFIHPHDRKLVVVSSPLPRDFQGHLDELPWLESEL